MIVGLGLGGGAGEIGHGHGLDAQADDVADGRAELDLGAGGRVLADDLAGGDAVAEGSLDVADVRPASVSVSSASAAAPERSGTATVSTPSADHVADGRSRGSTSVPAAGILADDLARRRRCR